MRRPTCKVKGWLACRRGAERSQVRTQCVLFDFEITAFQIVLGSGDGEIAEVI